MRERGNTHLERTKQRTAILDIVCLYPLLQQGGNFRAAGVAIKARISTITSGGPCRSFETTRIFVYWDQHTHRWTSLTRLRDGSSYRLGRDGVTSGGVGTRTFHTHKTNGVWIEEDRRAGWLMVAIPMQSVGTLIEEVSL